MAGQSSVKDAATHSARPQQLRLCRSGRAQALSCASDCRLTLTAAPDVSNLTCYSVVAAANHLPALSFLFMDAHYHRYQVSTLPDIIIGLSDLLRTTASCTPAPCLLR